MPKIPTFQADGSARVNPGLSEFSVGNTGIGPQIAQAGAVLQQEIDKRVQDADELHVTRTLADARAQMYERLRKKSEEAKPGAANFTAEFMSEFDAYKQAAIDGAPSRYARKNIEAGLANIRTSLFQSATDFEAKSRVEARKDDVRQQINKFGNSLQNAPHTFGAVLQEAERAVDAAGLPPTDAVALKKQVREGLAQVTVAELIRRSPGAAMERMRKGEFDAYLDPMRKSSLLDHANSEMRRRAAEARMIQAAERGDTVQDFQEYKASLSLGAEAERPKRLDPEAMKRAGFRPDQVRRIEEEIDTSKKIGEFRRKIATASADELPGIVSSAMALADPKGPFGARRGAEIAASALRMAKEAEGERTRTGSLLMRQAIREAVTFKETLVEGDPSGQPIYIAQKPTYDEWRAKIAPVLGEEYAKETYARIEKMGQLTPDKLPALFENLEKAAKPSDVLYAADNFYRQEVEQREKGLREQPGDYALKHRPEVIQAWRDHARIVSETKPDSYARVTSLRHAIDMTVQAQREMGVANPVLPKSFIQNFQSQLASGDPQSAAVTLRQMESTIGRANMPVFLRSLAKDGDTPAEVRVALLLNNPTSAMAAEIMSTRGMDLAKYRALVSKDQHDDIERAVSVRLAEIRATIPFAGDGLRIVGDLGEVSNKLALKYVSQGKSVSEAARMGTRWISEQYEFKSVNGSVIRVPKGTTVYTAAMARFLATFDSDVAAPPNGTREDVIGHVRSFGRFMNSPDDRGVLLLRRDGQILNDSAGRQIFIPWSAFSDPGAPREAIIDRNGKPTPVPTGLNLLPPSPGPGVRDRSRYEQVPAYRRKREPEDGK